jgi:hypothetical protein
MVYAFVGLPLDAIAQGVSDAVKSRFPLECPPDALIYHGRDRGIRRGPNESAPSYRARLVLWIEAWRAAGVGFGMLDQIAGYLTPSATRIRIWTQIGIIYTREADGSHSIERVATGLWDWDARPDLWSRFWVIIDSIAGVPWDRDGTWGDGELWGEAGRGTWGSTATNEEVASIRAIVADWKPAASVCKNIIVSFDASAFDPGDTSPPLPDGTWGTWGTYVMGVKRASRDPRGIYWRGVA